MTRIGVNLDVVAPYGGEFPFINRIKTAGTWTVTPLQGARYECPMDRNGFPIAQPGMDYLQMGLPFETYAACRPTIFHLFYNGTIGSITILGAKLVSEEPGHKIFDLAGITDGGILLHVYPGDAPVLPTKLALVRDDHIKAYKRGEVFNPDFVAALKPFAEIRTLNWAATNYTTQREWADRVPTTAMTYALNPPYRAVPFEVQVALANKVGCDLWINIPHLASDALVRTMLTYARDKLNKKQRLTVEWSNEIFNGDDKEGFPQSLWAAAKGRELWGDIPDPRMQYQGYRSAQIAAIVKEVFAEQPDRARMVLAPQTAYFERIDGIFDGVARAKLGSLGSLFDALAITNYFGGQFNGDGAGDIARILAWARGGADGLTQAFNELRSGGGLSEDQSLAWSIGLVGRHARFAQANGLELIVYEGGLDIGYTRYPNADRPAIIALYAAMIADPRMAALYRAAIEGMAAQGATQWTAYRFSGPLSDRSYYGALQGLYAPTVRYRALADMAGRA